MTNQSQALADALRKGEMAFRLDAGAIERDVRLSELTDDEVSSLVHAVVTAANLSQYEKPGTDRDQLREALVLWFFRDISDDQRVSLIRLCLGAPIADEVKNHGHQRICLNRIIAALASKTAIDPVTVEADTACNHIIAARTFLVISEPDHADRHLKAALRSLGSQS